jgi:peptidoglycan/xylan/chitin deacetylase (PgdA/CDA1 family)
MKRRKPDYKAIPYQKLATFIGLIVLTVSLISLTAAVTSQTVDKPSLASEEAPLSVKSNCPPSPSPFALSQTCNSQDWQAASAQTATSFLPSWVNEIAPSIPQPIPWPEINSLAKLAKVPVIMYHDIVAEKEVFFDVTPEELEAQFQLIQSEGVTPITMDQLVEHLQRGIPLPEKPVLLTFDDGYQGHYTYAYPLLKKYDYPAVFSIYTNKVGATEGRPGVTWEQVQEMSKDSLVTIACHTISHPEDLRTLSDDQLRQEIVVSKQILEQKLGIPLNYFTYPAGWSDERVRQVVAEAGYRAALSMNMNTEDEHFAGESENLLVIGRFGQSRLAEVISQAWGGPPLPTVNAKLDFTGEITKEEHTVDDISLILISGGRPTTIHADSRYQVPEIIEGTGAVAAVDGAFFSLKYLDSNVMIGPVLSHNGQEFVPGNKGENPKLQGRPLVLISLNQVKFIPFDADRHNTLEGLNAEIEESEILTDAFVGAAWLVKNGQPQPPESFANLYSFDVARHRAFWGINQAGQPTIGVSKDMVDSVTLGKILAQLGLQEVIMVDSGASTSLAYQGESLVSYTPRPVPHVVALFPPLPSYCQTTKEKSAALSVPQIGCPATFASF